MHQIHESENPLGSAGSLSISARQLHGASLIFIRMGRYPKTSQNTIDEIIKRCIKEDADGTLVQSQVARAFGVGVSVVNREWIKYRRQQARPSKNLDKRYPDHE